MDALIRLFTDIFGKFSSENAPDISLAADFEPGRPFRLYVGVAGIVKGIDKAGNTINRNFIAGYHPITMKKVSSAANGTTATDLASCY